MSEAFLFYRKLQQLKDKTENIKNKCKTKNSSFYDSVYSSTQSLDKRLFNEMTILREMIDRKKMQRSLGDAKCKFAATCR